ncbi:MAG: hypothetical protein ACI4QA_00895 [Candidatus Spyradosoma sp.]
MNKKIITLFFALLAAALFPACAERRADVWTDSPARISSADRETRARRRAHLREVLSRVVLVRMNAKGDICIGEDDSELLSPVEFSVQIAAIGKASPGKPVLFFYDEEAAVARPDVRAFVIRECGRAKLGRIYTEVPDKL